MSIARAFTNRRVKQSLQTADLNSSPQRSNSKGSGASIRNKISSPVELIHTTNMLSYNAPDLFAQSKTASSAGSSHRSDDDMSDSALTAGTTPPTSPDIETSPKRAMNPNRSKSPEPNHLSAYFAAPGQPLQAPPRKAQAPVIPQRAPSHSKNASMNLVRQRSASNVSQASQQTVSTNASYTFSRSSSSSTATSASSQVSAPLQHRMKHSGSAAAAAALVASSATQAQRYQHRKDYSESHHPFGHELAQVSEIAEEYGVKEQVIVVDAEEKEMIARGLLKFTASDYLGEVQGLISSFFVEEQLKPTPIAAAAWI
ncbi:hypothetical protein QBC42DRAFT_34693 [Cladorrhinum samala]|uniref:Uncharacterized protein n=1 Tax=Cladorrhinum samala TaxID=585594 RepID=A0AAV9HAC2_9PEZI|nr:hypothetical protein QBC42DRAFT_34693 [Cladorrhinum samala]